MSKPFIFVSCGQYTPAEKSLGKAIVKVVTDVTGLDAFFAEDVQDLNGLDSNILTALHDCVGFITVLHARGKIIRPDRSEHVRASVWIEQEIAIATYIQRIEKRSLPVIAFVHDSVGREGIRELLHLNPIRFKDESDILVSLPGKLVGWRQLSSSGIRVELDFGYHSREDHHGYSRLVLTLVNETNRRLDDVSFAAQIPKGALAHDGAIVSSENRYKFWCQDRSYYLIRQNNVPAIAPHDRCELKTFFYCSECALEDTGDLENGSSPITPNSKAQIRVWTGEREYSIERTLAELNSLVQNERKRGR